MSSNKKKLLLHPSMIVTVDTNGVNFKRGGQMKELALVSGHSVVIENDTIKDLVPNNHIKNISEYELIDVKDCTVLPGIIESHTHTAFAGSRAEEFRKKLSGVSYEEIARSGGGILTTVNAVRKISSDDFIKLLKPRIQNFIAQGITILEIKSGYGLDFENEIKILQVINQLKRLFPIDIIPTFLGAHTYPPEFKDDHEGYVNLLIGQMLPFIADNKLASFCDVFCEKTAFSANETDLIFTKAASLGLGLKLHTDQFNSIGGIDIALKHKAVSIDHLEVIPDHYFADLGKSDTVCTLLPGVSFFLNYNYAPARKLIDSNAIVSIATDYNPGSSNISSMHLVMSLAALKMKMSIEEVISSVTINAAKALKINKTTGSIETGKKADFSVLNTRDYADIVYNIGSNINIMTIKNGNVIYRSPGGIN